MFRSKPARHPEGRRRRPPKESLGAGIHRALSTGIRRGKTARRASDSAGGLARPIRAGALATFAAALLLAALPAEAAPAWRGAGGAAGAYDAAGGAVLELSCAGGGALRLAALSPRMGREAGRRASLVLDVDGTAFLLEAASDGRGRLAATVAAARAGPLVSALRRGKAAELRVPAGRYAVPLKGSGAALAPLAAACGLAG